MKTLFLGYAASLTTLAVLDALWLGVVSREFYKARLGQLLLDQPNWPVAILFYLIHALGIVVFAVPLAASWLSAALYGALFGFVVYAAYDLTNLATLRGWPMAVSVVDLAWGAVVTAAAPPLDRSSDLQVRAPLSDRRIRDAGGRRRRRSCRPARS